MDRRVLRRPTASSVLGAVAMLVVGIVLGALGSGELARRTGAAVSTPGDRAIDHVVIVVKENHTFDNYLGSLQGPGRLPRCTSYIEQQACSYDESDLPAYYRYAREFGLGDRYFVDVNGPSWPNHMMMVAGRTPLLVNPTVSSGPGWMCPTTCYDFPTIGDSLSGAGVSWRSYGEAIFNPFRAVRHLATDNVHNQPGSAFFEDVAAGRLPAVSWVRPDYPSSEHPGYDVRQGETWTVDVVNAIMRSRFWVTTAVLVTWDDGGTSTDGVTPPAVEVGSDGGQLRYGPRVPFLVISPYTPAGFVSHRVLSHVSTLRMVEARFGLTSLTQRDAQADDLGEFFDFSRPARPPLVLPRS